MAKHEERARKHTGTTTGAASAAMAPETAGERIEHGEIARLAYSYWEARGCPLGSPDEDWFHAELDLRQNGAVAA
jgi:hypothetical protein